MMYSYQNLDFPVARTPIGVSEKTRGVSKLIFLPKYPNLEELSGVVEGSGGSGMPPLNNPNP